MRWIVFILAFANIGYFAWSVFQQSHSGYQVVSEQARTLPKSGRRLVLVSESDNRRMQVEETGAENKVNDAGQSPADREKQGSKYCIALGPFADSESVDQVQQRLFSIGISSRERADQNMQAVDHWVHIPPLSSRDSAIRLLRELQAQSIDSFVITQGELTNGISLGLFSKVSSANDVSRRLMAAGYSVEIKPLFRVPKQWWLELDASDEEKLDGYFWSELISRMPDIKKTKNQCEGVVSGT